MSFDARRQKFGLDCDLGQPTAQEVSSGVIPLAQLNAYQYLTGPKYLLKQWLDLKGAEESGAPFPSHSDEAVHASAGRSFVLLLKREVDGNIFHNINEVMAIMITLDVLRMTIDPTSTNGAALFSPGDIENTQIIILDEHPDGPLFDLFRMFSTNKPLRVDEWIASAHTDVNAEAGAVPFDNVILPLAGAANNLWADFITLDCEDNEMLRVFVQRVFDLFSIPRRRPAVPSPPGLTAPRFNITLIHRRNSRKLMGLDSFLLDAARTRFAGEADIHLVDFAALTLQEQIQVSRDSDVLVGMHGAGLTQAIFMEEGRGAVVEIQPDRMCYKGFKNLAQMGGHAYLTAGANKIVGNCYDDDEGDGRLEMMPDGGTINAVQTSRCYSNAADPDSWFFACSNTSLTDGDQSYMICRHRDENDDWYKTCDVMEAGDIWWIARYVMKQERFLEVLGQAIDVVRKQQKGERDSLRRG
jgi:protein O-GlcNAc transferase